MNIKKQIVAHALKESPREACGLLIKSNDVVSYYPCRNMATGNETFIMNPEDYVHAENNGQIMAVVHSHPDGPAEPSQADRVACEASGLPWHIVTLPDEKWCYIEPCGYEAPLLGRVWVHATLDCYSLSRDWFKKERGVILPDFPRQFEWWYKGDNLYVENFEKAGFVSIINEPMQPGDALLMQILSEVPCHSAIYLGDNIILHHLYNRLSCREVYGDYYRKHTTHVLRFKGC